MLHSFAESRGGEPRIGNRIAPAEKHASEVITISAEYDDSEKIPGGRI
jgi:hypothetical protein